MLISEYSQRLQAPDTSAGRDRPSNERKDRRAGRTETRDPAYASRDELGGEDRAGVVHDDGEDGPEEEADERHADRRRV